MQLIEQLLSPTAACEHLPATPPTALANECQECGSGFNIRLCGTCGHVGCCDSQSGHARIHSQEAGHPIIYADPKGGGFIWCYTDNRYL